MSGSSLNGPSRSGWLGPFAFSILPCSVLGIFAFCCGAILLYRLPVLPASVWLALAGLPAFLWFLPVRRLVPAPFCALAIGFAFGMIWVGLWAQERLEQRLPEELEGTGVQVSGYVCDLPVTGSFSSIRFSFCVTRWQVHSLTPKVRRSLPGKLRLAWYNQPGGALPDHRLRLEVVLKRPHGTLNSEGFRYEDWLFRKGYRATGSVRSATVDASVFCGVVCQYHRIHARLAYWVDEQFSGARHHPLIASLLIGNRGHLSSEHWDVLKATGTIHLVAISGLHLGLVALAAGGVARRLLLMVPSYWLGEHSVRLVVFFVVLVCCLIYALAAGFSIPTQRALIMVAVGSWVLLKARQVPVWHSLVLALGTVLMLDPFAPLDQGFWLSFGAVSVLIFVFAGRLGRAGWLASLCVAQGVVFAGLWPILEVVGQGQPVAGLLANVVAIPWVSLVVMPAIIIGGLLVALLPGLSGLVVPLLDTVLGCMWSALEWVAGITWPDLSGEPAELALLALLVLLIATVPFRGFRLTGSSVLLIWAVVTILPRGVTNPRISVPEIRVWDVGQGLSAMIRAGDEVWLYDTGPEVKGVFSSAESVLLPNLRALGIRRIDTLVVSHADNDHSGGLGLLVNELDIGRIITGEPDAIRDKLQPGLKVNIQSCAGEGVLADELSLSLWQATGDFEGNDASCVLTVWQPGVGVEWVFPGDISARVETLYLQALGDAVPNNMPRERVVVAPHHGSQTSSSEAWVDGLGPQWVIYTAGYLHRYGHPHKMVTGRYRDAGAKALSTACSGSLTMKVVDDTLEINEARHSAPFWVSGAGLARGQCEIP